MDDHFLLWQLVDSALPTGGFAHSGGLESWAQIRGIDNEVELRAVLTDLTRQAAALHLPFVDQVHEKPASWAEQDALCEALLSTRVAREASARQGQALLAVLSALLPEDGLWQSHRDERRQRGIAGHLAPLLGLVGARLGLERATIRRLFVYTTVRDLLSAAVRLGLVGPLAAQAVQRDLLAAGADLITQAETEPVQLLPLQEIVHAQHDRLYSRLFAS